MRDLTSDRCLVTNDLGKLGERLMVREHCDTMARIERLNAASVTE